MKRDKYLIYVSLEKLQTIVLVCVLSLSSFSTIIISARGIEEQELFYDDGEMDWFESLGGTAGYAVKFSPPMTSSTIDKVEIYGCYEPASSGNNFFWLDIWDANLKVLYEGVYRYADCFNYRGLGGFYWATIEIPEITVYGDFYVAFFPRMIPGQAYLWMGMDFDPPISGRSFFTDREQKYLQDPSESVSPPREWMIRVILSPQPSSPSPSPPTTSSVDVAEKAAVYVANQAVFENGGCKWLVYDASGSWERPSDVAKIGLFFASLYQSTQKATYLNYAKGAAQWIITKAVSERGGYKWACPDKDIKSPGWWLNTVVWEVGEFLLEMYKLTGNTTYLTYAKGAAQWMVAMAEPEAAGYFIPYNPPGKTGSQASHGIMPGREAMVATFLLHMYRETGNSTYLYFAKETAEWLMTGPDIKSESGGYTWVHNRPYGTAYVIASGYNPGGTAGVANFLYEIYQVTGNATYLNYANGAIQWILSKAEFVNENSLRWPRIIGRGDYPIIIGIPPFTKYATMSDLLLYAYAITGNSTYLEYAKKHLNWILSEAISKSGGYVWKNNENAYDTSMIYWSLCNAFQNIKDNLYMQYATEALNWIINNATSVDGGYKWKIVTYNPFYPWWFINGASGIGYYLTRVSSARQGPGVGLSYTVNYLFSSMDVESGGVLHIYFQVLKHEVDGSVTPANGVPVKIQTSSGSMEKTSENYLNVDGIAHFSFSLPDYSGYCFSVYVEPSTFNGVPVYPPSVNPILWPVKPREALLHFSTSNSYEASLGVGVQGSLSQGFSLNQDGENLYGVSFSEEAKSGLNVDYHPFEAKLGVAHAQVGGEAGGGVIAGLNYGVFDPSNDTQKSIVKYLIAKWILTNAKVAAQSLPPAEKMNAQIIMMALNFVVQYELARLGADNYVCYSQLGGYGHASVEAEASVGLSSEKGSAKNTIGKIGSIGVSHESEIAVSLVNYGDGEIGVRGEASYNVQVGAGVDLNMGFLELSAGTSLVDAVLTIGAEIIYRNQQPSILNLEFSIEGSRASFESLSFSGLILALDELKIPSTLSHGKLTLILSMPIDKLPSNLAKYVKDLVFGEINLTQLLNEVYDEIANTPIQYEVKASFEGVNIPVNIGLKIFGVGLGYGWEYQEFPEVVLEKGFIWNWKKWTIVQYDSIPKSMNTLQFLKDYLPTISGIVIQLNEKAKHLYLHVYDNQGRHVGLNYETGQVETEIPDSYYFDNKNGTIAIVLPINLTNFRVEVDGRYAMETTEKYNLTTVVLSADRANYTQISASITKGETQVYNVAIPPTGPPTITKSENPWWVQHTLWIITGVIVTAAALTVSTALIKKRKAYRSQSVTKNKVNT
jgi:rhamnogalacturonyl hydrolase YesR